MNNDTIIIHIPSLKRKLSEINKEINQLNEEKNILTYIINERESFRSDDTTNTNGKPETTTDAVEKRKRFVITFFRDNQTRNIETKEVHDALIDAGFDVSRSAYDKSMSVWLQKKLIPVKRVALGVYRYDDALDLPSNPHE